MRFENGISLLITAVVLLISACTDSPTQAPLANSNPNLSSFDVIKNIYIPASEKKIGIINFTEFCRIYVYNYYAKRSTPEKQKAITRIQEEASSLRYSKNISGPRKPPVIMHWTDGDNALGAIRTLFKDRDMAEGVIGVDYVITEPLRHPDYPKRPPKSYIVNFSRSDVATTWFHVPGQNGNSEDRKYNRAINIEITGWRFLQNPNGRKADFGRNGSLGIRENFNGDFKNLDKKYVIYPTVLKLINYLAEKHNFSGLIDQYSPENEISREQKKNGVLYLDGPLSRYLKGHGLIAIEHTLKYGGKYKDLRHDFTPKDLLVIYSDLKGYRRFIAKKMPMKA